MVNLSKFRVPIALALTIALAFAAAFMLLAARYHHNVTMARQAVFNEDQMVIRSAIKSYTVDQHHPPQSLDDLIQAGYLISIPRDPRTGRPFNQEDLW
jgi:general secretion pathway protein G